MKINFDGMIGMLAVGFCSPAWAPAEAAAKEPLDLIAIAEEACK